MMNERPKSIPLDMAPFSCISRADYERQQLKAIQAKAVSPVGIDAELMPEKPKQKRRKVKMPLDIS